MDNFSGVYKATKKDGTEYYRSNITINGKHISLGSYDNPEAAMKAYNEAGEVFNSDIQISAYSSDKYTLDFKKFVILINYRDNKMYFKTPIYIMKKYFFYYFDKKNYLIFDVDDLFFYSTHSIMKRGGHLFVADFGMQLNILSRFGIRDHAVCGRDYFFANGDTNDYRYQNIIVQNKYYGVYSILKGGRTCYKAIIHINGNFVIGHFDNEETAAIAYNKAADILKKNGCKKNFPENYLESLNAIKYASIYNSIIIPKKIRNYKSFL